jgi:hypothetical protein
VSTPADRLRERLNAEELLLIEAFPTATLDHGVNAVILADHELPSGWSHEVTDVLFMFPDNYPAGCPDNVCARPDLRLANGALPTNNQGIQSIVGREWLQLSWHIEPTDWNPTSEPRRGSNLVTYLIGALTRFDEAT